MWVLWAKLFSSSPYPIPHPMQFHIHPPYQIRGCFFFFLLHNLHVKFGSLLSSFFLSVTIFLLFQGTSSLLDMILYYESTTHLDISDNSGMGTSCWRALAHLIKQVGWHSGTAISACRLPPGDSIQYTLKVSLLHITWIEDAGQKAKRLQALPLRSHHNAHTTGWQNQPALFAANLLVWSERSSWLTTVRVIKAGHVDVALSQRGKFSLCLLPTPEEWAAITALMGPNWGSLPCSRMLGRTSG